MPSALARADADLLVGYACDPRSPQTRFIVELYIDGEPVGVARADVLEPSLAQAGHGDGCYGFVFVIPSALVGESGFAIVRLANSDVQIGGTIDLMEDAPTRHDIRSAVEWRGGLRFKGWLARRATLSRTIRALIDEVLVADGTTVPLPSQGRGGAPMFIDAFDITLPSRYADGRARLVTFVADDGVEVGSGPIAFIAFADGLLNFLSESAELQSERDRLAEFDRMFGASLPFERFAAWQLRFPPDSPTDGGVSVAVVLIGEEEAESSIVSLQADKTSWVAGALPSPTKPGEFEATDLGGFLGEACDACSIVLFAPAGTLFHPSILRHLADVFDKNPDAQIIYPDLALSTPGGATWPLAFPAFDRERFIEQGYCSFVFAVRIDAARRIAAAGTINLFDVFFAALGQADPVRVVVHVPQFLATVRAADIETFGPGLLRAWQRRLNNSRVTVSQQVSHLFPAVRLSRPFDARVGVSVVIPFRVLPSSANGLIAPMEAFGDRPHEILVPWHVPGAAGSIQDVASLDQERLFAIHVRGPFNRSRLLNAALARARYPLLLIIEPALLPLSGETIDELLSRLSDISIGAVSPVILDNTGFVLDAGVVLGPAFAPETVSGLREDEGGYGDLNRVAREVSALTGDCLLARRDDIIASGGFDERWFGNTYAGIDLCLRLRAAGKRLVITPHAPATRHASTSSSDWRAMRPSVERELRLFRARWDFVLENDPFYNPQLASDGGAFSALAWPPRARTARMSVQPSVVKIPVF